MALRRLDQNRDLHSLLSILGLMEIKTELVFNFTNQRTGSSSLMSDAECDALIAHLRKLVKESPQKLDTPVVKMRKKLIHYAHLLGWKIGEKADMERINRWCLKFGAYHKPLNAHSESEMIKVLDQFENVYRSYLNALSNAPKENNH